MIEWQPIGTAPRDGAWFLICNADDGERSIEVGALIQQSQERYVEVEGGLYRKETYAEEAWRGFNNFHRATHWAPLSMPDAPLKATFDRLVAFRARYDGYALLDQVSGFNTDDMDLLIKNFLPSATRGADMPPIERLAIVMNAAHALRDPEHAEWTPEHQERLERLGDELGWAI